MEAELERSLFDSARDRYDSAGRWTGIVILFMLLFHIAAFHPYVSASRDLDAAKVETGALQVMAPKVETMRKALDDLTRTSKGQIDAVIARLLEAKIEDFKALNRKVQVLRGKLPSESPSPISLQMAPNANEPMRSDLPRFDPEVAERIEQVSQNEIHNLLRDYINTHIIERRFDDANLRIGK